MNHQSTPNEPPKRSIAQIERERRERYQAMQGWLQSCASRIDFDWGRDVYLLNCEGLPPAVEVTDNFTGWLTARCPTTVFPLWRLRQHLDHLMETEE